MKGLVVLIAGPDGSGKSTLATSLPAACTGLFRRDARIHWRPGLLPRPGRVVGREPRDYSRPHEKKPHGRLVSLALLGYFWTDWLIGGLLRVRLPRRAGALVVVERGWWDVAVDPERYRLNVPRALVRTLGRLLPAPDLVLRLDLPAEEALRRKQEVSAEALDAASHGWRGLRHLDRRMVPLDAREPAEAVLEAAHAAIVRTVHARSGWTALAAGRFVVPRRPRAAVRAALRLHHPVSRPAQAQWLTASALARAGAFALTPRGAAPPEEVRAAAARFRACGGMLAVARSTHPGRYAALVLTPSGEPRAVVKVATDATGADALGREARALERFRPLLPPPLSAPALLHADHGVLVVEAVPWRARLRPCTLNTEVAHALGRFNRIAGAAHGDFAPWNLLRGRDGWALVDWEDAHDDAPPFYDLFHFFVQAHGLIGRPDRRSLLDAVHGRGRLATVIGAYASGAELALSDAHSAAVLYLAADRDPRHQTREGARVRAARAALREALA